MNTFILSWKNQINKPLSMLLCLILFALGIGLISILLSLNKQLQEKFDKNLAGIDLVIGAKGSPLQMILCNMYHIDAPTGNIAIKDARPFLNPKHPLIKLSVPLSLGDSYKGYRIVGTTHEFSDSIYFGIIDEGSIWRNDHEVTIGASVARNLKLKIGDRFFSSHGLIDDGINEHDHGEKFKVVGVFQSNESVLDQLILCNTQTIWKVHDHEEESTNPTTPTTEEETHEHSHDDHDDHDHHDHHAHTPEPVKPLTEQVDKEITSILIRYKNRSNFQALNMPRNINENTDLQAANPAIEINRLYNMMGVGEQALKALAIIIIVVSAFSIFIALFNSLKERKYELALMRVMGATRQKLFVLVILEGLILAVLGFIIGIALSHLGMAVLANYMQDAYRYSFSGMEFMKEECYLFLGALLIGFLAAVIPALQAYNTDISATLTDS